MRVLIIHNFYKQPGGEDTVFENEKKMLIEAGLEIYDYKVSNEDIKSSSFIQKVILGLNTIWSIKSYKDVKKHIKKIKPDLVHIHNTFPTLSPSIYWAIKSENIPIVQTLHNYRIGCANGILYRDSKICTKCVNGNNFNSVIYNCYRESKLQTLPIFLMQRFHYLIGTYENKIDKYITLTDFSKSMFIKIGLPKEKISVKPNFALKPYKASQESRKRQVVYVGRITEDKGIDILLEAFSKINESSIDLIIIGDGPAKDLYCNKYKFDHRIKWLGRQPKENVVKHISESSVLVMTSKWYETFGMVLTEAMSLGTPVIAPKHGSFPEIVINNIHGLTYNKENASELSHSISKIVNSSDSRWNEMSRNCYTTYKESYSEESNIKQILDIYNELLTN